MLTLLLKLTHEKEEHHLKTSYLKLSIPILAFGFVWTTGVNTQALMEMKTPLLEE